MASPAYDVLLVSDLRLPGLTGRAVAEEIQAQAQAGYRTALLHVRSGLLRDPHPINPLIREAIEEGLADWLDPDAACAARLAVAHHPGVFAHPPARVPRVSAERKVLVVNHPLFDAEGRPFFDLRANRLSLADLLGGTIELAPAGPQIRFQLDRPGGSAAAAAGLAAGPRAGRFHGADRAAVAQPGGRRPPRAYRPFGLAGALRADSGLSGR